MYDPEFEDSVLKFRLPEFRSNTSDLTTNQGVSSWTMIGYVQT